MKKILSALVVTIVWLNGLAQNVGIGTTEPLNKLHLVGNLLVHAPTISTNTPPTPAQHHIIVNNTNIVIPNTDSTCRIYDPGGPSANYLNNLSGTVTLAFYNPTSGIELNIESIQLGPGDSLIIKNSSGSNGINLLAVGNGFNTPGKYHFPVKALYLLFKSNNDGVTGAGFSLVFKRLYNDNTVTPSSTGVLSKAISFDTKKGALRAGSHEASLMGDNSTALGLFSTAAGSTSFATGLYANADGIGSTAIGSYITASGDYSTAIGNYVSTDQEAGALVIGDNSTTAIMRATSPNSFRARFAGGYRFYTTSDLSANALLSAGSNAWSTTSDYRLKENFITADGESFLKKIAAIKLGSWNYKTQDAAAFRHYGPMAQDFYAAFGKDDFGSIGNDTTINQADFDGVNLIAIQALEKRTRLQQQQMDEIKAAHKKEVDELNAIIVAMQKQLHSNKPKKKFKQ